MSKSLFYVAGLLGAQGLKNGVWTPVELAQKMADSGLNWFAQEIGDSNTQPSDELISEFRSECHNYGLHWGIWEVSPRSLDNYHKYKPNFWLLNVESDFWDGYGSLLADFREEHPLLPAGVVTNCDFDAKPFIKYNIKCIPEAYQNVNSNATPANMVFRAKQMGYKVVFPVLGVWGGYALSKYSRAGNGYSVYYPENMSDADWATAKIWNLGN